MRPYLFFVCLFGWLAQVQAQEMGLDFSDDESATAAPSNRFPPSLAFAGIQPVGKHQSARAARLNEELQRELSQAVQSARFSQVLGPKDVLPTLQELKTNPSKCNDTECMALLAATLGVDRLLLGTLTPSGPGSRLMLWAYAPTMTQPATETAESPEREQQLQTGGFVGLVKPSKAKTEAEFFSRARGAWGRLISTLDTGLGKLVVDSFESSTEIRLSGEPIGKGSFEKLLERGNYSLLAEAEGFLPFSAEVHIRPHQVELVRVLLVAKPLDKPLGYSDWSPDAPRKTKPIYARPGFYVALAGAAAIGTGIALGLSAKSIEKRGIDTVGNHIIDITRKEAKQAKLFALLSNVLVGGGGAMLAGGTIWMFVAPGRVAENPLDDVRGGVGLLVGVGGTF